MQETCPACSFKFEGESGQEGFYIRSTSLNFGVTLTGYLIPLVLLTYARVISIDAAQVMAFGAAVLPVLLYRSSRSWALLNYYIFSPQELPANTHAEKSAGGDRTPSG